MEYKYKNLIAQYLQDNVSNANIIESFEVMADYIDNLRYTSPENHFCDITDTLRATIEYSISVVYQGTEYYDIFKFEKTGQDPVYIKFEGYYDSYEGMNYQENALSHVTPKEKTVTTTTIVYEQYK